MPAPWLMARESGLFCRVFVPADLRPHLGQRFLVRSLGSRDRDQARLLAARYALVIGEMFRQLRRELAMPEPKVEDIIKAIQSGGTRDLIRMGKMTLPNGAVIEGLEVDTKDEFESVVKRASAAVPVSLVALDFAHRHATRVERQDFLVKACPAGLVLGDDLGLKAAVTVARDFYGQFAKVAFKGFLALSIAGVASWVGNGVVFGVTQVFGHLGLQCTLYQFLGEQLEQAVLTDEVFRFLVISQQAVDQFVRDGHLFAFPWECSSFLPIDRLHKSSYTSSTVPPTRAPTRFRVHKPRETGSTEASLSAVPARAGHQCLPAATRQPHAD